MNISKIVYALAALSLLLFAACSDLPPGYESATAHKYSQDSFSQRAMDYEDLQNQLGLLVRVDVESPDRSIEMSGALSRLVEAGMGRINRFKVTTQHMSGAASLHDGLAAVGDARASSRSASNFDIYLDLKIKLYHESSTNPRTKDFMHKYQTSLSWTLSMATTGEVIASFEDLQGGEITPVTTTGLGGNITGGHNYKDQSSVDSILYDSVQPVLGEMLTDISGRFPVVGIAKGATSSRINLDKGTGAGLTGRENFLVILNNGGIEVPVMRGSAETIGRNKTTIKISKQMKDADTAMFLREFKENPGAAIANNTVYVVSDGFGIPEEWSSASKRLRGDR